MSKGEVMKTVKFLLVGIVILIAALAGGAFLLPNHVHVERQVEIAAPARVIFPLVNNFRNTEKWSPWLARDPQTDVMYSGPAQGEGARMSWRSEHPEVGAGSQVITDSEPDRLVRVALAFEGHGNATATFRLRPEGAGTVLVWGFDTDLGANPLMRYLGLMFDKWVGEDYEAGLANIKQIAEAG